MDFSFSLNAEAQFVAKGKDNLFNITHSLTHIHARESEYKQCSRDLWRRCCSEAAHGIQQHTNTEGLTSESRRWFLTCVQRSPAAQALKKNTKMVKKSQTSSNSNTAAEAGSQTAFIPPTDLVHFAPFGTIGPFGTDLRCFRCLHRDTSDSPVVRQAVLQATQFSQRASFRLPTVLRRQDVAFLSLFQVSQSHSL